MSNLKEFFSNDEEKRKAIASQNPMQMSFVMQVDQSTLREIYTAGDALGLNKTRALQTVFAAGIQAFKEAATPAKPATKKSTKKEKASGSNRKSKDTESKDSPES